MYSLCRTETRKMAQKRWPAPRIKHLWQQRVCYPHILAERSTGRCPNRGYCLHNGDNSEAAWWDPGGHLRCPVCRTGLLRALRIGSFVGIGKRPAFLLVLGAQTLSVTFINLPEGTSAMYSSRPLLGTHWKHRETLHIIPDMIHLGYALNCIPHITLIHNYLWAIQLCNPSMENTFKYLFKSCTKYKNPHHCICLFEWI